MTSQGPQCVRIVAFDGGLAHMGVIDAIVSSEALITVIQADVFVTDRGPVAKQGRAGGRAGVVTASADNRRRCQELSARIQQALQSLPAMVVCEAFSRPPHASAGYSLAMSLALIYAWSEHYGLPLAEVSPQTSRAVLGIPRGIDKKDGKKRIAEAVDARLWPDLAESLADRHLTNVNRSNHEHAYDAAAALIAATEKNRLSPVLTMTL